MKDDYRFALEVDSKTIPALAYDVGIHVLYVGWLFSSTSLFYHIYVPRFVGFSFALLSMGVGIGEYGMKFFWHQGYMGEVIYTES